MKKYVLVLYDVFILIDYDKIFWIFEINIVIFYYVL